MKSKKSYINLKKALCSIFGSTLTLTSLSGCARDIIDCVNNLCEETTTDCSFDETTSFVDEISEITTKTSTVGVKDNQISKKVSDSTTTTETTTKVNKSDFSSIDDNKTNGNSEVIRDNSESSNSNNNSISYSNSSENGGSSRGNSGSSNQTPQTQIQVTEPIVTEAPVTQPPVTEPPVIEPPVIETQPPVQSYSINDIAYNWDIYSTFASDLTSDTMTIPGYMMSCINMPYGLSNGYVECSFILSALNSGYINDSVLYDEFSFYSQGDLLNSKDFMYSFNMVENTMGTDVDYTKYTINWSDGDFLNRADQAYREGWFDSFIEQNLGNIPNNPGVMGILYSYDKGRYLNSEDINTNYIDPFINRVSQAAYGSQLIH